MAGFGFRFGCMSHPTERDEYWNNVVLLCPFDTEPNLSTTVTDATGRHTLSSGFAGAEVRHTESVFDNVGAYQTNGLQCLTGSLYSDDSADWHFTGDFTIEMNIFASAQVPSDGNAFAYISQQASDSDPGWLCYYYNNGGTPELRFLAYPDGGSPNIFSNAFTFSDNTWYHVAWVRSGNTLYQFVEGDLLGGAGHSFSLTMPDVDKSLEIGGAYDSNLNDFGGSDGRIDNVRITKGVARYTSSFTPPTGPHPVS